MRFEYPRGSVFYRNLHKLYPRITHGEGAYLFDEEGKKYLDASGGAAVVSLGHGREEIADALALQARKVGYINGMQFTHTPVEELARRISEFLPFQGGKVYFLNSGSEAIEASIKLARQYWVQQGRSSKYRVISRMPGYHGNTLAALSFSARERYKQMFRPMLIDSQMIPAPYCYRCFRNEKYPACEVKCAYELEKTIKAIGEESISAFLTEVIGGGSTGAAVPPPEYFQIIRKICDDYGILLIADEIMTGVGRTGKWLASQHFDFVPDIVVMGKGLTSGYFPLSAIAVKKGIPDSLYKKGESFLHFQTFAHHPVGCASALAVLDLIRDHGLLEKCSELGDVMIAKLSSLHDRLHVGDVRGKGLLIGVEFVQDKTTKKPFPRSDKYAENFIIKAIKKGLVLWPNTGHADGLNGDLILLAPPYIIGKAEIAQIFDILQEILSEMESEYKRRKA
jgi:adenosylmethionine-8-amino-7-oxononanoate aminotransferase